MKRLKQHYEFFKAIKNGDRVLNLTAIYGGGKEPKKWLLDIVTACALWRWRK